MHKEDVSLYTNQSITQRRYDSVYKRGTYIYQSIHYTEEVRQCIQKRHLYIPINQFRLIYIGASSEYTVLPPLCN
jgi:hypothetical protein